MSNSDYDPVRYGIEDAAKKTACTAIVSIGALTIGLLPTLAIGLGLSARAIKNNIDKGKGK